MLKQHCSANTFRLEPKYTSNCFWKQENWATFCAALSLKWIFRLKFLCSLAKLKSSWEKSQKGAAAEITCWSPRLSWCEKDVNHWVSVQNLSYTPGLWNYINLLSSKSPQIRASDGPTNPGWRMINPNPCSTLIMAAIWMLFLRHVRTCIWLGGRWPIGFSLVPPYMSTQQSSCGELCHRIGFKNHPTKQPAVFKRRLDVA